MNNQNDFHTLESVVSDMLNRMSNESIQVLRETEKKDLIGYLHTVGRFIRNEYKMWHNTELIKDCDADHPDDASMIIIETIWEHVNHEQSI